MKNKYHYFVSLFFSLTSCSCHDIDQGKLLANDYRLFQQTPVWSLAKSVKDEDVKEVNKVIKRGDFNYKEAKYGRTLLMLSVYNEQYISAKALLDAGADPGIHDSYNGTSAIIDAARINGGDGVKFLKLLLSHGANPNDEEVGDRPEGNMTRETPLLAACASQYQPLEKVRLLVEHGADLNYKNDYGQTALAESVLVENLDVVIYLLHAGADCKVPIFFKDTIPVYLWNVMRVKTYALDSKEYKQKMEIVKFLLSNGVDYRKLPIPDWIVDKIKNTYPDNWKEYLEKY